MNEEPFSVSELKQREKAQAVEAYISTTAAAGDERRYHALDTGLSNYSKDLFGNENRLCELVEIGISKTKEKPFRVLVLGAGAGRMAEELATKVGDRSKLQIVEISMGDPRTDAQKELDRQNNIQFINGDINTMRLDDNSYDLVISHMFMLHMVDPLRVIKKVSRSMKEGAELYADFTLTKFFVPRFRATSTKLPEDQASWVVSSARASGAEIFIDDTGLYYRKSKNRLKFNIKYVKDDKGRICYEASQ